ncbi:MAG: glucosamine-6-phosphate isomerase, partial [Candidatus Cloacimonetes bacterium]|nr:glucosamine-6-phosphate isomerase [Candidatus Cloacimonadota bacterium]
GAWEEIPKRAITIGFKQIFEARKLNVYMNREWQSCVLRKALLLDPTPEFPVTLLRNRNNVSFTVTPVVARQPEFALK